MSHSKVVPFEVEQWMDEYETVPKVLNIAETCVASISLDDLKALSEDPSLPGPLPQSATKLTYGPIRGSDALRDRLASLYSVRASNPLTKESILITPGAISANFLTLYSLVSPGDHVICMYPTYQQLYAVPASLGASVSLWKLRASKKWQPNLTELEKLLRPETKMLIINNPNNPTGATIPKSTLTGIVEFAQKHDLIVVCDEVYRPIFHGISPADPEYPPSLITLAATLGHPKTIVTGSMSKAYSLAGIRVGWIASRSPELISKLASARSYTNISVSQLDDSVAAYALNANVLHALLKRNIALAKSNLGLLEEFVNTHDRYCDWVKPTAGTTAFVMFKRAGKVVDDVAFCLDVLEKANVMLVPGGKCFGTGVADSDEKELDDEDVDEFKGYVRFGYVCETEVLKEGLEKLDAYMRDHFVDFATRS